jgi:hypothetical protein
MAPEEQTVTPDDAADQTPLDRLLDETGFEKGDTPDTFVPKESPTLPESDDLDTSKETPTETPIKVDKTDWKKRYADSTRGAQALKARAEQLEQELQQERQRIKRYEDAGLDFAEIDRFISGNSGIPSQENRPMETSTAPQPEGEAVTKTELNQIITRYNYDMAKRDFADINEEFRDTDMQELLDVEASKLAAAETQQYGSVTSQVDEIIREAAKKVTAKVNKFKDMGKKSATETRQKIKETALPEGDTTKKPSMEPEDEGYSPKDYAKMHRQHRDKIHRRPSLT